MADLESPELRNEQEQEQWYERTRNQILLYVGGIIFVVLVLWLALDSYIDPQTSTQKKDLVQALGLILAGVAAAIGIFFTWRGQRITRIGQEMTQQSTREQLQLTRDNLESTQKDTEQQLRLTEQGQITERFTRAIDQLGKTDDDGRKLLEILLGGIYALERIARDSPERDYSTVVEVLTAYVRENSTQGPGPSEGSSVAASTSNEATAEADEGAQQPALPEFRRSTADIQAILDVLSRLQDRVPEEYRISLDLHEANLQNADLREANLQGANFFSANLDANLYRANLSRANLNGANLSRAFLREADLQEANLQAANLQGVSLREANLSGAVLPQAHLYEAILYEAILRDADFHIEENLGVEADLRRANLQGADLRGADLRGADLQGADLRRADLRGTKVTDEQLADTLSLQGAMMPDGSKHP